MSLGNVTMTTFRKRQPPITTYSRNTASTLPESEMPANQYTRLPVSKNSTIFIDIIFI